ncbi:hypothetical protein TNCV_1764841 [Trichonephila clavipes]|nr:hypothetical protein TNCV_1764841 [Trichonephila clavipes]
MRKYLQPTTLDRFDYSLELDSRSQQQMEGFRRQPSERDRSLTDKDSWRHCAGKDNPSDLLTRGISADSLIN